MKKSKFRFQTIHLNVRLTMIIVGFFFCLIIAKLCYVVLSEKVDGINLTEFASSRNTVKETLYANRGIIYDKDGRPLAKNTNSYKVIAMLSPSRTTDMSNPYHVVDKEMTASKLCDILAKSEEYKTSCKEDLTRYFNQDLYQTELGIWGKITEDERLAIKKLDLPGIEFETLAKKRQYLNSSWASYILGYARNDETGEIKGEMGIEAYFDEELRGQNGSLEYQKDAYGYRMPQSEAYETKAISGSDIYLTIQSDVQNILENAIKNFSAGKGLEWATFTVMNAKTGEIVGSASNPNFNPNTLENLSSYLNPLVGYQYEPGSTMKVFSWMAAIENGLYNGEETYQSGHIILNDGTRINDFNNYGWGAINYDTGFKYSSNVAASNLGLRLGSAKLTDFYNQLGFGSPTEITLPGEEEGLININYESELANASFGQGILVTPIQLMQALTVIANDGTVIKPYIVSKMVDESGKVTFEGKRTELRKVASSETIAKIKQLMHGVVYEGFSYNNLYAPSNVEIGGKTGTAQIASPNGGYLTGYYDYIKSFLGFFPYEDPEYIFYFATKKFTGSASDISLTIANTIKDVANIVDVVEDRNDVDETKIIEIEQMLGKEVENVKAVLTEKGLVPIVLGNGKYVQNQFPLKGSYVVAGTKVFLRSNSNEITMPNVVGWSTNEIIRFCNLLGLDYSLEGYGKVESTNIPPNTLIDLNGKLEITLSA